MFIRVQTHLDLSPEDTWDLISRPSTFLEVCRPLLGVKDPSALPDEWHEGQVLDLRLTILGIPANRHQIRIIRIDEANGEALTNEHGGPLRTWNHRLYGAPDPAGGTLYTDEIDIGRGPVTPIIWAIGTLFFRYRQHRLRALAHGPKPSRGDRASAG